MGLGMLPDELLLTLLDQWPCREAQLRHLHLLLSPHSANPPALVVHGPPATGKSGVIKAYLRSSAAPHAIVPCQECVTGRHFLERTAAAVQEALKSMDQNSGPGDLLSRCESIAALVSHLQRLLKQRSKFVLVLDGVDELRDTPATLLPALARLGETIPQMTIVFVVRHPSPRFLYQSGTAHILFPPYTRSQSIHVVSRNPLDIFRDSLPDDMDYDDEVHEEDKVWLWPRFCAAVWDSLAESVARDIVAFRDLCRKLWLPFVAPIVKGDFGTRDFSRLLVAQRRLFQEESALLHSIISDTDTTPPMTKMRTKAHELPYYAKWLLVAAYLASFNSAKTDALYFMKASESKRRKKGGGTARSGGRPSKIRKMPRHLLAASAFTLDRLLAILHAVLPDDVRTNVNIYKQIAVLYSLRLLVRSGGVAGGDLLDAGGKWRVGPVVSWEYVQGLARGLDFNVTDYIAE